MNKKANRTAVGMPPLQIGLLMSSEERAKAIREHVREEFARMELLAERLGIPDDFNRWYSLALHFARQHVPELKEAKHVGSPKKWGPIELGVLAVEIERVTSAGMTVAQAAKTLATVEPWKSFIGKKGGTHFGPDPAAALQRAYTDAAKAPFTSVMRKAFRWHETQDTLVEWERDHLADIRQKRK